MRTLIVLAVGLLAVGCETIPVKELTPEEQNLRDMVVGEYGINKVGYTGKSVFLDNGVHEYYVNGKKQGEHKWTIVNEEIVVKYPSGSGNVSRINPDKSITGIADIFGGKREDYSKGNQSTWKKIK